MDVDGTDIFYREAGPPDAPVVLLPHGYPCSSFQYRHLMAALGDRWRSIAPDYPGFGHSGTPDRTPFAYTFDAYAEFLRRFTAAAGLTRYAIYLHDYGSQFGLRLAMHAPERVAALVIQNGDIYPDQHGPKYGPRPPARADPVIRRPGPFDCRIRSVRFECPECATHGSWAFDSPVLGVRLSRFGSPTQGGRKFKHFWF